MSSILKALKKLEEEKATRRPDTLNIDREILRSRPASRWTLLKIALVAVTLFICGAGAMYVSLHRGALPSSPSPVAVTSLQKQVQDKPVTTEVPATYPVNPEPVQVSVPVPPALPAPLPAVPPQSQSAKQPDRLPSARHTVRPEVIPPAATSEAPGAALSTNQAKSGQSMPVLKVDGIAYQDENVENIAIVNGTSVSKGSLIEGVTVVDVQRDRVKFSHGGAVFEVGLGKSSQ